MTACIAKAASGIPGAFFFLRPPGSAEISSFDPEKRIYTVSHMQETWKDTIN